MTIFEDFVVQGQGLKVRGQGLVKWSVLDSRGRREPTTSRTTTLPVLIIGQSRRPVHVHWPARQVDLGVVRQS